MILTPLQKLPNKAGDLGKIIVATCYEWLPEVQKIAQSGHTAHHNNNVYKEKFQSRCKMLSHVSTYYSNSLQEGGNYFKVDVI